MEEEEQLPRTWADGGLKLGVFFQKQAKEDAGPEGCKGAGPLKQSFRAVPQQTGRQPAWVYWEGELRAGGEAVLVVPGAAWEASLEPPAASWEWRHSSGHALVRECLFI